MSNYVQEGADPEPDGTLASHWILSVLPPAAFFWLSHAGSSLLWSSSRNSEHPENEGKARPSLNKSEDFSEKLLHASWIRINLRDYQRDHRARIWNDGLKNTHQLLSLRHLKRSCFRNGSLQCFQVSNCTSFWSSCCKEFSLFTASFRRHLLTTTWICTQTFLWSDPVVIIFLFKQNFTKNSAECPSPTVAFPCPPKSKSPMKFVSYGMQEYLF